MKLSYYKADADVPRGDPGYVMSQSSLKLFARNPWAWINGVEIEHSESIEWGSLVDCLLLTPGEFGNAYKIRPKTYPSGNMAKPWHSASKWCQAWLAEAEKEGLEVVTYQRYCQALKAAKTAAADPQIAAILDECEREVELRWEYTDHDTGIVVKCKGLLDLLHHQRAFLGDFKTSRDGDEGGFRRKAKSLRYDVQASWYQWGVRENMEGDPQHFAFLVQESKSPYPVSHWYLSAEQIEYGRTGFQGRKEWQRFEGYLSMLRRYCRCLADNRWPSYTESLTELVIHS